MIQSFKHKGLKRLYTNGERAGVRPDLVARIERVLHRLDTITEPGQMDLPGWRLHPLTGDYRGFWSVAISGNWRVIFRLEGGQPHDVELIDYH